MTAPACPEAEFIALLEQFGPAETARKLGVTVRNVYHRRDKVEAKLQRRIRIPDPKRGVRQRPTVEYPHRINLEIDTGIVLVGGDGHYWPGPASTAHRAFVKFAKTLKPRAVIMNGDAMDGARISRHAPIGWEKRPTLIQEIEACQERLGEIVKAAPRGCERIWNLGNHDSRFETRIATVAPEYANVHGVHLRDHFPEWRPAWSTWINTDCVIKHRSRGGIHATHNNIMWAGKTMVTNHLHSAKVTPFTDYNGTRYGVDTGCLADSDAAAFVDYTEDNPKNWREGFAVLTFIGHRLMLPELVLKVDADHVEFRGELIKV